MEKFEYDGEIYYFRNGDFFDRFNCSLPSNIKNNVTEFYFSNINYENMDYLEILDYVKNLRDLNLNAQCEKVCSYSINKFSTNTDFIKRILPTLTSSLRANNNPQKAIDYALSFLNPQYKTTGLLTSLAGAFCDVKDYENAKKYADQAYAMQGGSTGSMNELSLVYRRIKSETRDKYE